jgi:basic membrane lipoprotein Med (substrate-binding protein (PBP1-ABC) superfamily)
MVLYKFAIIGSRGFDNIPLLTSTMEQYKSHISFVISGGARGADKMGEVWANINSIPTVIHLPDWDKHGRAAGFIRNTLIVEEADVIIAFWDGISKGTLDSINKAKALNKPIRIINYVEDSFL